MMPKSLVLLEELQCPSLRLGFRPRTEGTDKGGVMIRMGKAGASHFPVIHLLNMALLGLSFLGAEDPGGQRQLQKTTAQGTMGPTHSENQNEWEILLLLPAVPSQKLATQTCALFLGAGQVPLSYSPKPKSGAEMRNDNRRVKHRPPMNNRWQGCQLKSASQSWAGWGCSPYGSQIQMDPCHSLLGGLWPSASQCKCISTAVQQSQAIAAPQAQGQAYTLSPQLRPQACCSSFPSILFILSQ